MLLPALQSWVLPNPHRRGRTVVRQSGRSDRGSSQCASLHSMGRQSRRPDGRRAGKACQCGLQQLEEGEAIRPSSLPLTMLVRQARKSDAASIAALCAEAFPHSSSGRLAWGLLRSVFPPRSAYQWQQQLERALDSKAQAGAMHHALQRLRSAHAARLKAGGKAARAAAEVVDSRLSVDKQQELRLYLRRAFFCLVAIDVDTGRVLGTAALSMARPLASLPPPFPTSAQLEPYISNVAVQEDARRQGVASALLNAAEQLVSRWGYERLYLHVEQSNTAGVLLYGGRGYDTVRCDPDWIPGSALLMQKMVRPARRRVLCAPAAARIAAGGGRVGGVRGRTRDGDGVFVWEQVGEGSE